MGLPSGRPGGVADPAVEARLLSSRQEREQPREGSWRLGVGVGEEA